MTMATTPASIEQRLLWYMDHYRGTGGVLNCPVIIRAEGPLDRDGLARALDRLVARHESLRTTFEDRGRRLKRVVRPARPAEIAGVDLRVAPDPERAAHQALDAELRTWIDPTRWPMRLTLWRLADETHILCVNMHHLAADGWSCGVVFNDVCALYDRACGGSAEVPRVAWQYSDYVRWQHELTARDELAVHRDYWREQLRGARLPPLPLRPAGGAPRLTRQDAVTIGPEVCAAFRRMARERRTTMFTVMLSLYYALIHRLTGERDLAVTSLFANRLRPELGGTVGAFSNMLILRTQLTPRATFGDVLREAHATVLGAFLHQAVPFQALPGVEIGGDSFRADDVVFHMTADRLGDARTGALDVRTLQVEGVGNRFALEVVVLPRGGELTAVLSYDESRIDRPWAQRFAREYAAAAAAVAERPNARLDALVN